MKYVFWILGLAVVVVAALFFLTRKKPASSSASTVAGKAPPPSYSSPDAQNIAAVGGAIAGIAGALGPFLSGSSGGSSEASAGGGFTPSTSMADGLSFGFSF